MTRISNHSLSLHTVDMISAVVLGTISNLSHEPNTNIITAETGDVYDVMQVVASQQPQLPFGTLAIKTLLTNVPALVGKCIDSDGTHPGLLAYGQSHDSCQANARGAAGTHMSLTCGDGHILITQISASKGGPVTVGGIVYGLTPDGNAYPFQVAYNANLPASPVQNEVYGLGKAQILGTTVDRITDVSLNFSPAVDLSDDADSTWPTLLDIDKVPLVTTITTEDPAWLNPGTRIGYTGNHALATDTFIHFLRHAYNVAPVSGGKFMDFAVANHIKGTLTGLVHVSEPYNASGSGKSTTQISIASIEDSGVAPLVWDLASTYTL